MEGLAEGEATCRHAPLRGREQRAMLKQGKLIGLRQHGSDLGSLPTALRAPSALPHLLKEGLARLGFGGVQAAEQQVLLARSVLHLR